MLNARLRVSSFSNNNARRLTYRAPSCRVASSAVAITAVTQQLGIVFFFLASLADASGNNNGRRVPVWRRQSNNVIYVYSPCY